MAHSRYSNHIGQNGAPSEMDRAWKISTGNGMAIKQNCFDICIPHHFVGVCGELAHSSCALKSKALEKLLLWD